MCFACVSADDVCAVTLGIKIARFLQSFSFLKIVIIVQDRCNGQLCIVIYRCCFKYICVIRIGGYNEKIMDCIANDGV